MFIELKPINTHIQNPAPNWQDAMIIQRIGALIYDLLLLLAIFAITTLCLILIFRQGQAIPPGKIWYQALLLFLGLSYFIGFWYYSGQTTGMAAFGLYLQNHKLSKPRIYQLGLRAILGIFTVLLLGLGIWYCFKDRDRQALYDRIAGTRLVRKKFKRHKLSRKGGVDR